MKQWATVNKHLHQRGAVDNTWYDVLMLFIRKQPILFYSIEFNALHWNQWQQYLRLAKIEQAQVILDKEKFPENQKSPSF